MNKGVTIVLAAVVVLAIDKAASAQTGTGPPGAVRGLFGGGTPPSAGRTTQQVSAWFDVGGGYDQDLDVAGPSGAPLVEGYASTMVGTFRYWRGRTTRSIEASARGYRNRQQVEGGTATGGEIALNALANGSRAGGSLQLRVANESAILFGAFGPAFPAQASIDPELDPPDLSPPVGDLDQRWLAFGGAGSIYRSWSTRQRTTIQFSQLRRRPQDTQGLDSSLLTTTARHDWTTRPSLSVGVAYRFERLQQDLGTITETAAPVRVQSMEATVQWQRRVSSIRTFSTSVTAGAAQVFETSSALASLPGSVEPIGTVTMGYTLSRRWLVSGTVGRSVTALQGVALAPFSSDAASVSVTGVLSRRITLVVTTAASRGVAAAEAPGSFEALSGTATVRYGFRYGGVFAGYTRYRHETDQLLLPTPIAQRFEQHSARAGVTLWLPLFGGF